MTRYLSAEKLHQDDFGDTFTKREGEVVYDAVTRGRNGRAGPWATMTQRSFDMNGMGRLGTGFGQKYVRNAAGELHKVEG
jgi:hypothetical protein